MAHWATPWEKSRSNGMITCRSTCIDVMDIPSLNSVERVKVMHTIYNRSTALYM